MFSCHKELKWSQFAETVVWQQSRWSTEHSVTRYNIRITGPIQMPWPLKLKDL